MPVENEHFAVEALRIVNEAERTGVRLRILGSTAYRIHCPENLVVFEQMDRALTDVDLAGEKSQSKEIQRVLDDLGYEQEKGVAVLSEGSRYVFRHPASNLNVDIFMDELFFCHRIPFKGRLQLDHPTITTTDLLLEKMQIVELNLKDIKDTIVLLLEHPIRHGADDREAIDASHITKLLGDDWGFYHTVTTNLRKVREFVSGFDPISVDQMEVVSRRIGELLSILEESPKSMKWKMRARVGTKVKWYQEVAEKAEQF